MKDDERIHAYLRSWQFRVLSWASAALLLAWLILPHKGVALLYGAAILSIVSMLPALRYARNRKIDFRNRADRKFVLFVAVFLVAFLIFTYVYIQYAR